MQDITIISDYKTTKKGKIALFSQEEFLFSVDSETFAKQGLEKGTQLLPHELSALKSMSDTRRAKDAALRYLSLRAYAEKELFDKLLIKFDERTCAAVMAELSALEVLNDSEFAAEKAKGMAGRGKSSREIIMKLRSLGISEENIENAMQNADADDYAAAVRLLEKSYVEKLNMGKKQQVMAALARRGFSHSVIKAAIEEVLEQE